MCFKICSVFQTQSRITAVLQLQTTDSRPKVHLHETMAGYKPVVIQTYPVLGEKITQDTLYWNNYKVKFERK